MRILRRSGCSACGESAGAAAAVRGLDSALDIQTIDLGPSSCGFAKTGRRRSRLHCTAAGWALESLTAQD